jgi:hypothetical protein
VILNAIAYVVGRLVALIFFALVLRWILAMFMSGPRLVWTTSLLAFVIASVSLLAKARGPSMQEFGQHTAALALCTVIILAVWLKGQSWIGSRHG